MIAVSVLTRSQRAALEALADTLLPRGGGVEPGARDVDVAGQLEAYLGRCEPGTRRTVALMLTAFDLSALASRHLQPFRKLSPIDRERYVHQCELSGLRQRREALVALKALVLMFFCGDERISPLIGFDGRPRKPVSRLPETPQLRATPAFKAGLEKAEADVVVVGSGAGGAVVARELAEAGLDVVVLEEGGQFARADFLGPLPERLRRLYRGNGLTFTFGEPVISLPMGMGLGGSTLVNSGTCFRTPDFVLDNWAVECGIRLQQDELAPIFERVEDTIGVTAVDAEIMGPNGHVLERGRAALGMSGGPIRRNARGCHGHGVCAFGCPIDAKVGMHLSYLPLAAVAGARIHSHCRVDRILVESGRAIGVMGWALDPETGLRAGRVQVRARRVVLAAGALHTPSLLMRNRLGNSSGQLGRNLRVHPGCGVLAAFDEDLSAWRGVMQSYYVDEKLRRGVLLEATYPPPGVGYSAGGLPEIGLAQKDLLAQYRQTAALGLIVSDSGSGRVRNAPGGPLVFYSLSRRDLPKVLEGISLAAELYLAAGAREVHTLLPGLPPVRRREELRAITEGRWRASDLKLSAYHPMGTCRMGSDPRTSVVDEFGSVHDLPGLSIADAAILPGSTAVNPQVTIMALATRVAGRVAAELC